MKKGGQQWAYFVNRPVCIVTYNFHPLKLSNYIRNNISHYLRINWIFTVSYRSQPDPKRIALPRHSCRLKGTCANTTEQRTRYRCTHTRHSIAYCWQGLIYNRHIYIYMYLKHFNSIHSGQNYLDKTCSGLVRGLSGK